MRQADDKPNILASERGSFNHSIEADQEDDVNN
jgi:hypothetical protein